MNSKAMVYPYDSHFSPVLRHPGLIGDFEIVAVCSPNGWGLNNKDAGCVDGLSNLNLLVTSNFDDSLSFCDTVIFIESDHEIDYDKLIFPKILKSVHAGKNIVCCIRLSEEMICEIKKLCADKKIKFTYYGLSEYDKIYMNITDEYEIIYDINTPVIFVLGVCENTNKFEIQLALREQIIDEGFKVSQIGTKRYCNLLGFISFPLFMYNNIISESNKVVMFNRLIKKIELEEKPDIIIIGIPGGVLPINSELTNKFGILAFELCQAVQPDIAILSTLCADYKCTELKELSGSLRYKLGFEIDYFNLGTKVFDYIGSKEHKRSIFSTIDSNYTDNKVTKLQEAGLDIYNVLNKNDSHQLVTNILNKFNAYAEIGMVSR